MKYEYNKLLDKKLQKTPDTAADLSNVAAGYIAATNVQDAIDELNDEKVQITPGQTINVSTAAELTAALAGLAAAPSLGGNIIIQLAAGTYSANYTIPTLLYNGFTLTIRGTLTQFGGTYTATGGGAPTAAALCYITDAGLTANDFNSKLVKFTSGANSGKYYMVDTNTAINVDVLGQGQVAPVNGDTYEIYDWGSHIDGNVTIPFGTQVYFEDMWISDTVGITNWIQGTQCYLNLNRCKCGYIGSNFAFSILYANACMFTNSWAIGLLYNCQSEFLGCKLYAKSLALTSGFSLFHHHCVIDGVNQANNGIYSQFGNSTQLSYTGARVTFVRNCNTGLLATSAGSIIGGSGSQFTNNVNNYLPVGAADPSYVS